MTTEFTILITEVNQGYVSFPTKEEAVEWLNNEEAQDLDLVKWTKSEITTTNITSS